MTRQDQEFEVEYGYWIETMLNSFWRRIDVCINISLIILGTSVAASLHVDMIIGLLVALFAAINVVIQPLKKAIQANAQSDQFSDILDRMDRLSDEELSSAVKAIRNTNSDEIGILTPLAYNRAAIRLGLKPDHEYRLLNRLAGHFIGDVPESRP
jgi:hypothetical protein